MYKDIFICGGTHGNEKTGIYLISQQWPQTGELLNYDLSIKTQLINLKAIENNTRYVDEDLNRCFSKERESYKEENYELKLAKDLKRLNLSSDTFVLDLHTTTGACGSSIVLVNDSHFTNNVVFQLKQKIPELNTVKAQNYGEDNHFLNNISNEGFLIEVGPTPQGVLKKDIVERTNKLVLETLSIIQAFNEKRLSLENAHIDVFSQIGFIPYPRDEKGQINGVISPEVEAREFQEIREGDVLFYLANGEEFLNPYGSFYPALVNEAAYYEKDVAMLKLKKDFIKF